MTSFCYLIKRNLLLYYRDRSAVFFSLLSVLIILLLMLFFLGDMNKNELIALIESAHGTIADTQAMELITMWTIAGILSVNTFTIPITMIGLFVGDREKKVLDAFRVAPISRLTLLASYLFAAIVNAFLISVFILGISYGYCQCYAYSFLSLHQLGLVLCYALLHSFTCSCILLLLALMVKSEHAWGAFSTLAGTLIGFLGGIYLPMGMLPAFIQSFLKVLPFLHQSALLRDIFCEQSLTSCFSHLDPTLLNGYQEAMGIRITWQDHFLSNDSQVCFLLVCGIMMLGITWWILRKKQFG